METICPRCKKAFKPKMITPYQFLFCTKTDPLIVQYISDNYDNSICSECTKAIEDSFYTFSVNPAILSRLKGKSSEIR